MDVPILVCECGMRIRAPGAKPGRVGRCPSCGGRLEVPGPTVPDRDEGPIGLVGSREGGFGPIGEIAMTPARAAPSERTRRRGAGPGVGGAAPMADGLLALQRAPEAGWLGSFLYPMRGAESLAVIAAIGVIAWVFSVMVPEYCLQAMADTTSMGAEVLGKLFVWLAALPALILGPFVLAYWLQYLGRVQVSGAMGESVPPRTPDRNFDGFLNGLSPWLVWLVLGLGVGLAPASWWVFRVDGSDNLVPWPSIALAVVGLPYILAALMLSFLHEDALAATPWGVIRGLVRLGPSFLLLSGLIAAALGLLAAGLALLLWVRSHAFWLYLLMALPWWIAFLWIQMTVMRLLGVFYFHRKDSLRWNREHPRWGVAWRL